MSCNTSMYKYIDFIKFFSAKFNIYVANFI